MDVVVPAHNEESAIARCLDRLADATAVDRIVVVPNGCRDRTAEVAGAHPAGARVLPSDRAGKAAALNLGDTACAAFPRAYLDADVDLAGPGLDALAAALAADPAAQLVVPAVRLDLTGVGWPVRRYLAVQRALPSVRAAASGRGVYVLSERGHAAVFPLPDGVIADDGYVARRIPPAATVAVPDAVVVVRPPRDLASLVRRRLRVQAGNAELDRIAPGSGGGGAGLGTVWRLVRARRVGALDAAVFAAITALVRLRAAAGGRVHWGTDTSSRA